MQRVSSVTAFVLRYLAPPDVDPEARAVVGALSPIERRVLELLAGEPSAVKRRRRLADTTGEVWEAARYDRIEARALLHLQHELQQRGLLQP